MTTQQPEALRLADLLEMPSRGTFERHVADELRRLHEANQELLAALKAYQKAGFCNSTDYELQGEAYDLAAEAIAKAERTTP
jgi:hypothetical protein